MELRYGVSFTPKVSNLFPKAIPYNFTVKCKKQTYAKATRVRMAHGMQPTSNISMLLSEKLSAGWTMLAAACTAPSCAVSIQAFPPIWSWTALKFEFQKSSNGLIVQKSHHCNKYELIQRRKGCILISVACTCMTLSGKTFSSLFQVDCSRYLFLNSADRNLAT